MVRFFILLTLVIGLMWLFARLGRMSPQHRSRYLKIAALWIGGGLLLAAILTGKLHPLFAIAGAAFPWIQRFILMRSAYQMFSSWKGPAQGAKPGQSSDVRTKFLEMVLDHDTGAISGTVIAGNFKGRTLNDLSVEEIAELISECQTSDKQSVSLIQAYLDKMRPDEWDEYAREHGAHEEHAQGDGSMSKEEALQVLELAEGATKEEIIESHRRLMQRNHPDRGGSTWVAARINQAKDVLLS